MTKKTIWYICMSSRMPALDREIIAIDTKIILDSKPSYKGEFWSAAQSLQEALRLDIVKISYDDESLRDMLGEAAYLDHSDSGLAPDEIIAYAEAAGMGILHPFDPEEGYDTWDGAMPQPEDIFSDFTSREILLTLRQRSDCIWAAAIFDSSIEALLENARYKLSQENMQEVKKALLHYTGGDGDALQKNALDYVHEAMPYLQLDSQQPKIRTWLKGEEI